MKCNIPNKKNCNYFVTGSIHPCGGRYTQTCVAFLKSVTPCVFFVTINVTILDILGKEVKDVIVSCEGIYIQNLLEKTFTNSECNFTYRSSIFKNKLVSTNFELATKQILLEDLVKFSKSIKFKPELLILEAMIDEGYIILDFNLNLDQNGKIKNEQ